MSALRREPPPRSPPTMNAPNVLSGWVAPTVLAGPAAIQSDGHFSVPLRRSADGGSSVPFFSSLGVRRSWPKIVTARILRATAEFPPDEVLFDFETREIAGWDRVQRLTGCSSRSPCCT